MLRQLYRMLSALSNNSDVYHDSNPFLHAYQSLNPVLCFCFFQKFQTKSCFSPPHDHVGDAGQMPCRLHHIELFNTFVLGQFAL